MRARLFLVSLATLFLASFSAEAALSKYTIRATTLIEYNNSSPVIDILTGEPEGDSPGIVLIDNDGGSGSPILLKWTQILDGSRKKRIAIGSGNSVQAVNQLIKQFNAMQKMFSNMNKGKLKGMSKNMMSFFN